MKKEYKVLEYPHGFPSVDFLERDFNKLGKDGWVMVATNRNKFVFMRDAIEDLLDDEDEEDFF